MEKHEQIQEYGKIDLRDFLFHQYWTAQSELLTRQLSNNLWEQLWDHLKIGLQDKLKNHIAGDK